MLVNNNRIVSDDLEIRDIFNNSFVNAAPNLKFPNLLVVIIYMNMYLAIQFNQFCLSIEII